MPLHGSFTDLFEKLTLFSTSDLQGVKKKNYVAKVKNFAHDCGVILRRWNTALHLRHTYNKK